MKGDAARLRVIGGTLKGRRLEAPRGRLIRPTADRVREALFDILGPRIAGAAFLDAYAGTGAIGIEALSRGAGSVTWIEKDRAALDLLRRNVKVAREAPGGMRVVAADLARAVAMLEREGAVFDIVYVDPPYQGGETDRALRLLGRGRLLAPGSILVSEHESRVKPAATERLQPTRTAVYGSAALTFYRLAGDRRPRHRPQDARNGRDASAH